MINLIQKRRHSLPIRVVSFFICISFSLSLVVPPQSTYAQTVLGLPQPGVMLPVSPGFTPTLIKGIKVYPDNPLRFDFIVDPGDSNTASVAIPVAAKDVIPANTGCVESLSYVLGTSRIPVLMKAE